MTRFGYICLWLLLLSGLISGCTDELPTVPITKLVAYDYVTSVSPDRFLKAVHRIETRGDSIFINDQVTRQLLILNNDLELIGSIGNPGSGPGELPDWPLAFDVSNKYVYAHSGEGLHVFSLQGKYTRTISLPIRLTYGLAVDSHDNVYISPITSEHESSILKLDSSGTVIYDFGDLFVTDDPGPRDKPLRQRLIVTADQQYLMSIGLSMPVVEKYSLDGDLIARNDLSETRFFAPRMAYSAKNEKSGARGYVTVANNVMIVDSLFYVLVIQGSPDEDLRTNTILAINTETLEIQHVYELSDHEGSPLKWVSAYGFTASGELVAFHYTDGVFYNYGKLEQES